MFEMMKIFDVLLIAAYNRGLISQRGKVWKGGKRGEVLAGRESLITDREERGLYFFIASRTHRYINKHR